MTTTSETISNHTLVERTKEIISQREFSLFIVLVVACLLMSFLSPVFFTWANAEAMLLALSVDAIIAIGMVASMLKK